MEDILSAGHERIGRSCGVTCIIVGLDGTHTHTNRSVSSLLMSNCLMKMGRVLAAYTHICPSYQVVTRDLIVYCARKDQCMMADVDGGC